MNTENIFSFRMFDLYRRFVEIIQTNEEFLKEFKTGFPSEDICRAIIGKTFQHRQPENNMSNMVDYLRKNAPILVAHAENLPDTWSTAVRYTNWCISEIKRYLKNKNISIKSDFDAIPGLSKEIGKCIYKNGANQKQIEIIEEFLKEDIKNPKRSIAYSQKSKKCKHKEKILSPIPSKEKQVVENEESNSIVSVDVHDESSETQISTPQSFLREDLLKTEFTAEFENLLQPHGLQSTNDLLHIASSEESNEFVLEKSDLTQLEKSEKDKDKIETCNAEDIQSILENSKCESEENDFIILEVTEESDTSKDKTEYSSNITPTNYYITDVNNANSNKRRIVSNNEHCAKKLFLRDEIRNNENPQYITVNTDDKFKDSTWNSIQYITISNDDNLRSNSTDSVQILNATGNERIQIDESYDSSSEIIVDKCEKKKKEDTNTKNNQTEVKNKMMDVSEIKTEPEVKQENGTCICSMEFKNRTPYIEETVKYSDIMNMTYTEVLKMMEKILAFCELKNEISLEEFLVLRRTRDKMHWRSLKENTSFK